MSARIGVVGSGWWATQAHLPSLQANPDAIIAGIADTDPVRRETAARAFGDPPTFPTLEGLLECELDGVVISTPHASHHPLAALALDHGLHVLLEKPMTIEPADAHDLVRRAEDAGVELIVGYPYHFNRQSLALRETIARGTIGRLEHVACLFASIVREFYRGNPHSYADTFGITVQVPDAATYSTPALAGGGQGQTQVTHSAALLLWLTGLTIESLAAFTADFDLQVDLADAVAVRFVGGAVGTLASTGGVAARQPELLEYRIFGDEGDVLFEPNEGLARIRTADGAVEHLPVLEPGARYPERAPAQNLVDVALGRAPNGSPPGIAVATVELIDAVYRSARDGTVTRPEAEITASGERVG